MNESAWLEDLRTLLPGATDTAIKQGTRLALRDFYTESGVFVVAYPKINVIQNTSEYSLQAITSGEVLDLISAKVSGKFIHVVSTGIVSDTASAPSAIWFDRGNNNVVLQAPAEETILSGLELFFSAKPYSIEDSTIPDSAGITHYATILHGALSAMYRQPSKPYTDQALANYNGRLFRRGISRAKEIHLRGNSSGEIPWEYPKWA